MEPLPIIHLDRCTGCHGCIDICPTQALSQINGKAQLHYPAMCTYCTACENVCPEGAIELPYLVVFAENSISAQELATP